MHTSPTAKMDVVLNPVPLALLTPRVLNTTKVRGAVCLLCQHLGTKMTHVLMLQAYQTIAAPTVPREAVPYVDKMTPMLIH